MENVYVGDRLVSVYKGEHFGKVVRDPVSGNIVLVKDDKVLALGCTSDAGDTVIDFWEKKLGSKVNFRISADKFRDTGLEKAVLLPPKRSFEETEKTPYRTLEEENYYLKKDLNDADRYIRDLKSELHEKSIKLDNLLAIMKCIKLQTAGF